MADEAASGVPLVGSRISLISKKSIRYEGVLYNINTSDASLALQNGKLWVVGLCPRSCRLPRAPSEVERARSPHRMPQLCREVVTHH